MHPSLFVRKFLIQHSSAVFVVRFIDKLDTKIVYKREKEKINAIHEPVSTCLSSHRFCWNVRLLRKSSGDTLLNYPRSGSYIYRSLMCRLTQSSVCVQLHFHRDMKFFFMTYIILLIITFFLIY